MNLRLDWATAASARYACERWHYSRSVPPSTSVRVGAWESGTFIGVVMFGRGASSNLGKPYGLRHDQICELTRVALKGHLAPVSQIVSIAARMMRGENKGLRLVVSFADPAKGHHGGIYQAMGWLYSGLTAPEKKYTDKAGREWHHRQVSVTGVGMQFGVMRQTIKISDCLSVRLPGKHRYLLALDKEMAKKIEALRKPYPKRAGSIVADALAVQVREGGSTPTSALQSK